MGGGFRQHLSPEAGSAGDFQDSLTGEHILQATDQIRLFGHASGFAALEFFVVMSGAERIVFDKIGVRFIGHGGCR